jgi:CubicO group peptidase (beta-lactamase class C family)
MLSLLILAASAVVDLSPDLRTASAAAALPAMQATVVNSRGLVAHGAAGLTVLGGTQAVTNRDAFHIGSCAKPFTATLAGMLVDEGKLTWTTRVLDVFPEWKDLIRPEFAPITLTDLLTHEAGVQPFTDEEELKVVPHLTGTVPEQRRQFARFTLTQAPIVPPRTAYKYSNAGFVIAAAMIEKLSGRAWEQLIEARIFKPLRMRSAGVGWPARVWGHDLSTGTARPIDPHGTYQLPSYLAPAADLHMSSDDLAALLRAHLRAMRGEAGIVSTAAAKALHEKHLRSALGFGSTTMAGFDTVATHNGSADTFFTVIAIAPSRDVAVAVSTNAAGDAAQKSVSEMLKAMLLRFAAPREP